MNFNYNTYHHQSYGTLTPPVSHPPSSLQCINECNNYVYPLSSSSQLSLKSGIIDQTINFQPGHTGHNNHPQWPVKFKHKTTTFSKSSSPFRGDNNLQMSRFVSGSGNVGAIYANFDPACVIVEDNDVASTMIRPSIVGRATTVKKKTRTIFTSQQINELEKYFNNQQYITCQERDDLAAKTKLTPNQVKIW